ncbi:SapC family protein [Lamprobacter modestohalophilus]|uniref:SapC family protein n=1 Tax=Lamprobacter modestohalophilus TaxID=1064514 RepID=UPI002ADEF6E4|nr:SapC family protein [Lamprobacter modestohalophilus]MEA1050406.1 SapC family protein [Lamprobacter modestohalophilus]
MKTLQPITLSRHRDWRWRRYSDYRFAEADALAPLVAQELTKAAMSLPIALVAQERRYSPVAVQALQPGRNLFVGLDGRWLGGYVPAAYRGYPFALATTQDDQQVLCVDEGSGLVLENAEPGEGEPFFDAYEQPAEPLRKVLEFLQQVNTNRAHTAAVCQQLAELELIQPWPLKVQTGEAERPVEGLFRVDEAALNALPADGFEVVRQAGALPLIYCQLLSMQHIGLLGRLAEAHQKSQERVKLDASAMFGEQETLSFDWGI